MSNYLSEIENEFSRGCGSRLSPMDWNLAQTWWDGGIPLHVVIGAMRDALEARHAQPKPRPIKSLSYFTEAVEERYDQWKSMQIGKTAPVLRQTEFDEAMRDLPTTINTENVRILRDIADAFPQTDLPEPLASAVLHLRGELFALADEAERDQLDGNQIEDKLTAFRCELNLNLIASTSDEERAQLIKEVQDENGKFQLMPDSKEKVLIRKLRAKFDLPELTLYAL